MTRYGWISVLAIVTVCSTSAFGQEPASRWDHNGSEVGLYPTGNERIFRYTRPRPGLEEVGVTPGTVLFVGRRTGDTYSGQAYVFSRRCGPQSYFVSGKVSEDNRTVTLDGDVPVGYDARCRPTAMRPDRLVFTFIEPPTPPVQPGVAVSPPPAASPPAASGAPAPSYPTTGTVGDTGGADRTADRVMN